MHIEIKRVCVPTDFSEPSAQALLYGATFAKTHNAELHLLHVVDAVRAIERCLPRALRVQPDHQIRAGAAVAQRVELALVELHRPCLELRDVLAPGCDRIGLVEPGAEGYCLPETLDSRLALAAQREGFLVPA